ncbi:MAG: hypothetical protein RBT45_01590 [Acholeplasmataceae bacterium]|jgi:hypothetical protein|nr:hypothetical protein [Acholeplasmataceae bacterium]
MTKMTRKLLLAVLTVVVTIATLGTTTFAWFTLTNTSVIQNFNANVITDAGIEIALADFSTLPEDLVWKTTLTTDDILDYMEFKYGANFAFNHVTSPDGVNFNELGLGDPLNPGVGTSSGFIALPIHFRSSTATEINWTQVTLSAPDISWRTPIGFTNSKNVTLANNATYDTNAADAMRVSVTGDLAGVPTTVAYENPVSATNTVLGAVTDANLTTAVGAVDYYFQVTNTYPGGIQDVTTVDTVTTVTSIKVIDMTTGNIPVHEQEYYGTLTIRIWFEGWDAEALNALLGRTITAGFRFQA